MIAGPGDPIDVALVRASARKKLFGVEEEPLRIGRFVIERRLGSGTMGVVYAAYDPELDRKVALKLLHAGAGDHGVETSRLRDEAKALARLRHPNVVAAHDLGTWRDRVFLAMEYVDGVTLRRWMATPRSRREKLAVMIEAGRGLAAAHRAGIVHRDFKSDNVLVAAGGEVKVVDFGLASTADDGARASFAERGAPADQHAFCVTLHELVFGVRPVDGAVARGRGPARIRRILARGLSADPSARFASMDELVAALADDPAVRVRRLGVLACVAAVAGTATFLVARGGSSPDECAADASLLADVWDPPARARLASAFTRTGSPHAADAIERVAAHLDAYTTAWHAAHRAACRTRVRTPDEPSDRRIACLQHQLQIVGRLVERLAAADVEIVHRAPASVFALPEPAMCSDARALVERMPPTNVAMLAGVDAIRAQLARVRALMAAGDVAEAARAVARALADARSVAHPPTLAETLELHALVTPYDNDATDARWIETARVAAEAHDDRILATAWIKRMLIEGYGRGNLRAGLKMQPFAEAAVARAGRDPLLLALLRNVTAILLDELGRHADAQRLFEEALALRIGALGPEHPDVAAVLSNLGDSHRLAGNLERARDYLERSLEMQRKILRPYHPAFAFASQNLGAVLLELGDLRGARARTETAIALYESVNNPPDVPLATLGLIAFREGRIEEARSALARARAIVHVADHPRAATIELYSGIVARGTGRLDDAVAHLDRAIAILERTAGRDHASVAEVATELGLALAARAGREPCRGACERDRARAREVLERAVAIYATRGDARRRAEARFALARMLATSDPPRARSLALSARDGLAGDRLAEVDAWLRERR